MSDSDLNEVTEFANTDAAARRRELAAAGASAPQHLDELKKRLGLPNLVEIETETRPLAGTRDTCPELVRVQLVTKPGQKIRKKVLEQWSDGTNCHRATHTFPVQFTGYGSYCMSFERDRGNTGLFRNFFSDVAGYEVNLHRTMLFLKETYENKNEESVHHLLVAGKDSEKGTDAKVNTEYLDNLDRMVSAAKSKGVVVQVCLFMHHAVEGSAGCEMPKPVRLDGGGHARYKAFCNTKSLYQPAQINFIDGVVTRLLNHWNVVYEIGNELRVPGGAAGGYGEEQLSEWIDWVAGRVRAADAKHLITTSTGVANEKAIDSLARIQFCSFHQGQWRGKMNDACDRAASYGDKHVVFDDDGGARPLASVKTWSKSALETRGGGRASFNHKGAAPVNDYNPRWLKQPPPADEPDAGRPVDALAALKEARHPA